MFHSFNKFPEWSSFASLVMLHSDSDLVVHYSQLIPECVTLLMRCVEFR